MHAIYASGVDPENPLSVLEIGDVEPKPTPEEWVDVDVKAMSLNHHDVWALRGQALRAEQAPMILGTDAAGIAPDGTPVVIHAVIGTPVRGDETLDPKRSLLSEVYPGTFADKVRVPAGNLIALPEALSFEQAACLPTAYLTAYRMLATKSGTQPGDTVLIQGAGGGVSTAAVVLGKAMGLRVWVTSRDSEKGEWAKSIGADEAFEVGARLPDRVDAVIETVGEATWDHSLKSLRPGGTIVVSGATSGAMPPSQLNRVFFLQLQIAGSTMGTAEEFSRLLALLAESGVRPIIDRTLPMDSAREGFAAMIDGTLRGKIVMTR
ncbi:MAG: zinc-binding dehydrogenase [Candidatus Nanopelagicales bacterium]|mgnify:CR=1 FL=1|jgi:NADPH:quinone reductase-like Zn-dependent oxidoreductase|nr:zinc-binding dehydrogenase [Actinomycetes bacterium]